MPTRSQTSSVGTGPITPLSCEVVVPGPKGHFNYIRNIVGRLEPLGFAFWQFPYRLKSPGQPQVGLEAQIKRRQMKETTDLTAERRVRIEQNRCRAIEIRAQQDAFCADLVFETEWL